MLPYCLSDWMSAITPTQGVKNKGHGLAFPKRKGRQTEFLRLNFIFS